MKVKSESEVAQLCPTLSDPVDCSLSGLSAGVGTSQLLYVSPRSEVGKIVTQILGLYPHFGLCK